jgi:hypothetical protein
MRLFEGSEALLTALEEIKGETSSCFDEDDV